MTKKKKKSKNLKLPIFPVLLSTLMLGVGTYAWFTYFSDVDSTMTGHVIGWNIDFDGKTNIENEYEIIINNVYPGMEDYINDYKIKNSGEAAAMINYEIKKIRIFDEIYKVGDTYEDEVLTTELIMNIIKEKYSFKFDIEISKDIIRTNETSIFTFSLKWPFESYVKLGDDSSYDSDEEYYMLDENEYKKTTVTLSNFSSKKDDLYILNDVMDTYWGTKAYQFKENNSELPCIELEMVVNATQYIED